MLHDIVIDTCTLVHASNPESKFQTESISLINHMLQCDTLLCIDEGFDFDETLNQSRIGLEYLKHLHSGMLGFGFLVTLFLYHPERISEVPSMTDVATGRWINQKVRKPGDKVFAKVTNNTIEKVLVSHDFEDFQKPKRQLFKKEKNIRIVIASEAVKLIK